ncbi:MAG: tetratricopeptide repeat protein [Nitrospirota bacterium]
MAKIKKKSGKTMLSPEEEIRSITHAVSDQYQKYRQPINVAITLLVVVALGLMVASFMKSGNEKKAGQLLSSAYDAYSPGGAAPANYPLALQRFQEVVKQYGGTVNGAIARFSIGNTYVQMGQLDAAVKEYESFLKDNAGDTFMKGLVSQRLGYAYLALGKQEEAKKAFTQAESLIGTGAATLELARIYDRAGNSAEAQKRYKEISEKLPATAWASEARLKLPPPDIKLPAKPAEAAK